MLDFKDLPQNHITDILDRAFHIKNNFFDAGHGCVLPQRYREISEQVRNFKVRSDDVFLCSYPRTGSTWLQEILWLLGNDLDFEKARSIIQQVRNPTLELSCLFSDDKDKSDWIK
jgi:estrone sulfotransferase